MRHFIDLLNIPAADIRRILDTAHVLKQARGRVTEQRLSGKSLAMIFEKNSTRTRVSFEVGMHELGGHALYLNSADMQLGRGETVADTARVLSRFVHAILWRGHEHARVEELAAHASVPVINGLSNLSHPCQIMADLLTIEERLGTLENKIIAWVGDGNNVAHSFISAACKLPFTLRLACPTSLRPHQDYIDAAHQAGAKVQVMTSPQEAVQNADVVVTDCWISMGDADAPARMKLLSAYQVDAALMKQAAPHALFMHCLPAHRGEEVTAEVIDGEQSAAWDAAENRLHVQKAILLWCLGVL